MTYTAPARRNLLATSAEADIVVCLEITHPELDEPVRVVNDTQDLVMPTGGGDVTFVACPFELVLPDDVSDQVPKATLQVDNIGRELTQWLEYSRGGKGARCRIIQTLRSDPSVIEYDITVDMSGISIDNLKVTSELGYKNTLMQPAVTVRYDPFTSPGLF